MSLKGILRRAVCSMIFGIFALFAGAMADGGLRAQTARGRCDSALA